MRSATAELSDLSIRMMQSIQDCHLKSISVIQVSHLCEDDVDVTEKRMGFRITLNARVVSGIKKLMALRMTGYVGYKEGRVPLY